VSLAAGQRLAFANVDLPFYVAVTELMLVWSRDSWRKFVRLANDFEVLIVGPGDRAAGARFLQSRLQVIPQAAAGGLGSVLGLFCGMLSMEAEHRGVVADLPYLASMLVTGAVGASVVYWLWAGVTFLGQVSQLKSLTLAGEHEGHSLIRNIYGIVGLARIRVGVGLFLAELPLLVLAHSAPHSHVLLAATAAVFLLCFATLAATGIGPDIFLGRVARTSQDSEIKELIGRRARLEPLEPVEAFQADCHLRQTIVAIRSRPVRRLSASTVANVTAATVTALLPFVALVLKYGLHL
jgi:hypothetical protein